MSLINCEINVILIWSVNWVINNLTGAEIFGITDTKRYVLVVTFSAQGKPLQKLKSSFKRTTNLNKYQLKVTTIERKNQYLDYFIDPSFQWVSKLFVLSFEDNVVRTAYAEYFFPKVEIKYYNLGSMEKAFLISQ